MKFVFRLVDWCSLSFEFVYNFWYAKETKTRFSFSPFQIDRTHCAYINSPGMLLLHVGIIQIPAHSAAHTRNWIWMVVKHKKSPRERINVWVVLLMIAWYVFLSYFILSKCISFKKLMHFGKYFLWTLSSKRFFNWLNGNIRRCVRRCFCQNKILSGFFCTITKYALTTCTESCSYT